MSKLLVRSIELVGYFFHSASEDSDLPSDGEVGKTYLKINEFLKRSGYPIIPLQVQHLPFIDEGFLTPSRAFSFYVFNNCLIANGFRPYLNTVHHIILGASNLVNESGLEMTLDSLKAEAGLLYVNQWEDIRREIIDFPEPLRDPFVSFIRSGRLLL